MPRYVTEFIGTLFLVLTIGLTAVTGADFAPLAIGATLRVMVYMGGHVSGAHYNPAVSLAFLLRGKLAGRDFLPYLVAQVAGAVTAGLIVFVTLDATFAPAPDPTAPGVAALLIEFLYTFALCLVVLHATTAKATEGNSFYGLAIGFTITAAAFAGGPVSGGAFNPAVGLGPILVNTVLGSGSTAVLWLYLVGPFLGGAAAAACSSCRQPSESGPCHRRRWPTGDTPVGVALEHPPAIRTHLPAALDSVRPTAAVAHLPQPAVAIGGNREPSAATAFHVHSGYQRRSRLAIPSHCDPRLLAADSAPLGPPAAAFCSCGLDPLLEARFHVVSLLPEIFQNPRPLHFAAELLQRPLDTVSLRQDDLGHSCSFA